MRSSALSYLVDTVMRSPHQHAVRLEEETETYAGLLLRAHNVVKMMPDCARGRHEPVMVYVEKSIDALVCIVASLLSGNAYCPVDTRQPLERLEKVISNLSPVVILTTENNRQRLASIANLRAPVHCVDSADERERAKIGSLDDAIQAAQQTVSKTVDVDPAYVIYTSGSTGTPKGVAIAHRGVVDYIEWARGLFDLDHRDVIASQSPFFFDNSTLDLYMAFATGATLLLVPDSHFTFPAALVPYLIKWDVSFIFWVPSALISIANRALLEGPRPERLRWVVFAGEVMPPRSLAYWMQRISQATYVNLYGPTEITVDCTWYVVPEIPGEEADIPIGRACANTGLLILSAENVPVATGEIGELCVRGSSLALGYWNAPELTAAAFVQNPLHSRFPERIYRTGDLVYEDTTGNLRYVGRKDHQVKLHGYRIELGEIEAALSSHDAVVRACVMLDPTREQLVAAVESAEGNAVDALVLQRYLLAKLPKYMIPARFMFLQALPQTPNGKVDRRTLHDTYINVS